MMSEDKNYELRSGSVYEVKYGKKDDKATGIFCGYVMVGSETAVVIDSNGKIIYIPASAISCMVLVEQASDDKPAVSKDNYYG